MQAISLPFGKNLRLNKASDFKNLFRLGKKVNTRHFAIYIKPNYLSQPRLGMIVAKKAVRLATNRNQIKRTIRESFRLNQTLISGYDILVIGYNQISTLDKTELHFLLTQQWKKLLLPCAKLSSA